MKSSCYCRQAALLICALACFLFPAFPSSGEGCPHEAGDPVIENLIPMTCTTPAVYDVVRYCRLCGVELSRNEMNVPSGGHAFDDGVVTKPATCTQEGILTFTCRRATCGEQQCEEIPPLGHAFDGGIVVEEPSCTHDGRMLFSCTREGCDETESVTIPKTEHTPEEARRENETAPTCLESGRYDSVITCSVCGKELSRTVVPTDPPLGHLFDAGTVILPPTAEAEGLMLFRCLRDGCEATETAAMPLHIEHEWDGGTLVSEATCTEDGEIVFRCTEPWCTATFREVIAAIGHDWHSDGWVSEPTCTAGGVFRYICANDGCHAEKLDTVPASGEHSWDAGEWIHAATCTESGQIRYTCLRDACGAVREETVPPTGHSDVVTILPPTENRGGGRMVQCKICGRVYTEIDQPPLSGDLSSDNSSSDDVSSEVPTGSQTPSPEIFIRLVRAAVALRFSDMADDVLDAAKAAYGNLSSSDREKPEVADAYRTLSVLLKQRERERSLAEIGLYRTIRSVGEPLLSRFRIARECRRNLRRIKALFFDKIFAVAFPDPRPTARGGTCGHYNIRTRRTM